MGWASANPIFDAVADKLIELDAGDTVTYEVCAALIAELQDGDWDTEDESLDRYLNHPAIVDAFRAQGVVPASR